jgi:mannosyltransferase OCH1-like enzyme
MIFHYTDCGSYAGFADHFRYKLLLEKGGWWPDLDMPC